MKFYFRPEVYRDLRFSRTSTWGAEYANPFDFPPPSLLRRLVLLLIGGK